MGCPSSVIIILVDSSSCGVERGVEGCVGDWEGKQSGKVCPSSVITTMSRRFCNVITMPLPGVHLYVWGIVIGWVRFDWEYVIVWKT